MELDLFEGFRRIKLIIQALIILFIPFCLYWGWESNVLEKFVSAYEFVAEGGSSVATDEQVVTTTKKEYSYEKGRYMPKAYVFPKDTSKEEVNKVLWWNHFWSNLRIGFEVFGCALLAIFSVEVIFRATVWVLRGFTKKRQIK